jgi:hypothetical protein
VAGYYAVLAEPFASRWPWSRYDDWWAPDRPQPGWREPGQDTQAKGRAARPGPRPLPGWKQEALLRVIEANPGASDYKVAKIAGVTHKTAVAYRRRGGPPLRQKPHLRLRAAAILLAGEKWCPVCGETLCLEAFARLSVALDGRQIVCRRCQREYKEARRQGRSPRPPRPPRQPEWPAGWDKQSAAAAGLLDKVTVPPPPPARPARRVPVAAARPPSLLDLAYEAGLASPIRFGRRRG